MKFLLTTILLCFQLNFGFSQIILTDSSNGYRPIYTVYLYYNWGDNPGYYPASANYTNPVTETWDFHDMTFRISERLDYNYCSHDSSKVTLPSGAYSQPPFACVVNTTNYSVIPSDNYFIYNTPDTLMKYPIQLGDRFATKYYAVNPISSSSLFRTVYGSDTTVVDAIGTLILPFGTYNDVLRIKVISNYTDTSYSTSDTIYKFHSTQYRWYSTTQREFLMIIDTSNFVNMWLSPYYQNDIMSGFALAAPLSINNLSNTALEIYPNPTQNVLTITASHQITNIIISNLLGQVVYSNLNNTNNVQIDVSSLPPGIYLVRINNTEIRKFLKQ